MRLHRAGWRYLLQHPGQLILALLGIALGVASVLGIELANQSARQAFELSVQAVSGRATHQLYGPPAGIPEDIYVRLRRAGVVAAPVVEGHLRLDRGEPLTGKAIPISGPTFRLLGLDLTAEAPFRAYTGAGSPVPMAPFLTVPGAVLMSGPVAERLGLSAGQELPVYMGTQGKSLRLVGLLEPSSELSRRALEGVLVADVATAQEVLGLVGRLSRIDLILPEGRLPLELPDTLRLVAAGEADRTLGAMSEAFHLNLTALSLLSLVVGMFLIYQTSAFTVVQRRFLWGRLRTLGVTRGEILRLVLAEAAMLGSLGTLLGMALGLVLSQVLLRLVTRTLNDLYFVVSVEQVSLDPGALARAGALGLVGTLLAALAPAWEATTTPAGCVLSRADSEERASRLTSRMALAGAVAVAVGAGLLAWPGQAIVPGLAGMFSVMVGLAVTGPWLVGLLSHRMPLPGLVARLGVRSVRRSLSRTAVALAALTLAVSATVGIGVMVDSFRTTLVHWLAVTLQEDVYLAPPTVVAGKNLSTLDAELIELVRREGGVASLSLYRGVDVGARTAGRSGQVRLVGLDASHAARRSFVFFAQAPQVWEHFEAGGLLVSEPLAYRWSLGPGDQLELLTEEGYRSFEVAGVFADYGSPEGAVLLARPVYVEHWRDPLVTSGALTVAPGTDVDELVERLTRRLGDREVLVRSNRALREASLAIFERTFAVTDVLRMLAVVVAFVGLASSLIALGLERSREIAILRSLGLTTGQVWQLLAVQSGWMGLWAGLLALPLGLVQALGMIYVINKRSFGWTLQFSLSPSILVQALLVALAASLAASAVPAWRQARMMVAVALREE